MASGGPEAATPVPSNQDGKEQQPNTHAIAVTADKQKQTDQHQFCLPIAKPCIDLAAFTPSKTFTYTWALQ